MDETTPRTGPAIRLLTVKQAADVLDVTEWTVRALIKRQGLPHLTFLGRIIRIPEDALWAWVRRQQREGRPCAEGRGETGETAATPTARERPLSVVEWPA
jgi:excisionase family DNA binding protein